MARRPSPGWQWCARAFAHPRRGFDTPRPFSLVVPGFLMAVALTAADYERTADECVSYVGKLYGDALAASWLAWDGDVARGALESMAPFIEEWRDVRRDWARAGKRPDGGAYTWETWLSAGREYAASCASIAQTTADLSVFNVVAGTVKDTATQVTDAVKGAADTAVAVAKGAGWLVGVVLVVAAVVFAFGWGKKARKAVS